MCIQLRLYTITTPTRYQAAATLLHLATMAQESIGELEHLILLTILNLSDGASAIRIRAVLESESERRLTRGALYRSLDRLGEKGLIDWNKVEPTEDRGGHAKRFYLVSATGMEVVRSRRNTLERLWAGAAGVLGG